MMVFGGMIPTEHKAIYGSKIDLIESKLLCNEMVG